MTELQRLGRLVRRFAMPGHPPYVGNEVTLADLHFNLAFLVSGLYVVLTENHPFFKKAREVDEHHLDPLPVWREFAAMPWDVVEEVVWVEQRDQVIWQFQMRNR